MTLIVVLASGGAAGCATGSSGAGCRPASAMGLADTRNPPAPHIKKRAKPVCSPSTSDVWKKFEPYRGNIKTNGLSGSRCRLYTWDYTHGDIEVWDCNGRHLGSMDPSSGAMTKPPVKNRRLGVK